MKFNLPRPLAADDIFISYTRRDASTYANGLAKELDKRNLHCYLDALGTEPGADLPETLKQRIRNSQMLLLVCTRRAGQRDTIRKEIEEFLKTGRKQNIIPVDINGSFYKASWLKLVEGIHPAVETNSLALKDGNPSPQVIERIDKQFVFRRGDERRQRLQRNAIRFLIFLGGLIILAVAAVGYLSWLASDQRKKAEQATARATQATHDAQEALAQAKSAQAEALRSSLAAAGSNASAGVQQLYAQLASDDAKEKTRLAEEAARKAEDASARAKVAQARAVRQQTIAAARSDANRAQTLMRQRPEEASRSLKVAVDSMNKSVSARFHSLEADTALRESLALTPHLYKSYPFASGDEAHAVRVFALSPDGDSFGWLSEGKLHVGATGGGEPKAFEYKCEAVALSNGATRVAAIKDNGGVEIIDMKTGQRRTLASAPADTYGLIALSPGGRYLAYASVGRPGSEHIVSVVDVESDKVVTTFEQYAEAPEAKKDSHPAGAAAPEHVRLDVEVNDVAFGPTGDLAVGGSDKGRDRQNLAGRLVTWRLHLYSERSAPGQSPAERGLVKEDFAGYEVVRHKEDILAVAPGLDDTYFATDKGVWEKAPGQLDFEPVARLGYRVEWPTHSNIQKLAFSPDGTRLTLIKSIDAPFHWESMEEKRLETWDSAGYRNLWRAFPDQEVTGVGFAPTGQLVAAMTGEGASGGPTAVYSAANGTKAAPLIYAAETKMRPAKNLSPAADFIIQADAKTAVVWDVWADSEVGRKTEVPLDDTLIKVEAAAISPGGRFFALSGMNADKRRTVVVYGRRADDDTYRRWRVISQDEIRKEKGAEEEEDDEFRIMEMSLSADGRRIAVRYDYADDDRFVRVWDVAGKRNISPPCMKASQQDKRKGCEVIVQADGVRLSPNGRFVMVKDNSNLSAVLDLSKGEEAKFELLLEDTMVTSAAFSPDSRYLALGTNEDIVHVFESERPTDEVALLRHDGTISAVAFSIGNKYVATASHAEGTQPYAVRVWPLQPDELLDEARARLDDLCREGLSEAAAITCPRASLSQPRRSRRRAP